MAIIVQQQITPIIPHINESRSPPKINHNILPKVLMLLLHSFYPASSDGLG